MLVRHKISLSYQTFTRVLLSLKGRHSPVTAVSSLLDGQLKSPAGIPGRARDVSVLTTFRQCMGYTQFLETVGSFPGLLRPGREVDCLMLRLRMRGAISPLTLYTFLESTGRNVSLTSFLDHFFFSYC